MEEEEEACSRLHRWQTRKDVDQEGTPVCKNGEERLVALGEMQSHLQQHNDDDLQSLIVSIQTSYYNTCRQAVVGKNQVSSK